MKIEIRGPWHKYEAHADQDRSYFKFLFRLDHSYGKETVTLSDHREYRATATIDTDDYEITKKDPSAEKS